MAILPLRSTLEVRRSMFEVRIQSSPLPHLLFVQRWTFPLHPPHPPRGQHSHQNPRSSPQQIRHIRAPERQENLPQLRQPEAHATHPHRPQRRPPAVSGSLEAGKEKTHDARCVPHTQLDVILMSQSCPLIERLALYKKSTNRLIRGQMFLFAHAVQGFDHRAIQLPVFEGSPSVGGHVDSRLCGSLCECVIGDSDRFQMFHIQQIEAVAQIDDRTDDCGVPQRPTSNVPPRSYERAYWGGYLGVASEQGSCRGCPAADYPRMVG